MADSETTEAPLTLGEARKKLPEVQTAIKSYLDDKGELADDLTADDLADFNALVEFRDELKAMVDGAGSVKSYFTVEPGKDRARGADRPAYGRSTEGAGESIKAETIEPGESSDEKYLESGPFKSFGHFCYEVRRGGQTPGLKADGTLGEWNGRLKKIEAAVKADPETKALSGLGEMIDSEGAAFVPPQYAAGIWERSKDQTNLAALIDMTPVSGNSLTIKAWNDKTAANNSVYGGTTAYWRAEAGQMSGTKPKTRDIRLKLNELYCFFYASDELLEDAVALENELSKVAAYALTKKSNEAIIAGDGVGKPIGLLAPSLGCRLTIAAESGQGSGTIVGKNITNMFARRAPGSDARLVWLYNVDCEPQLDTLNFTTGATTTPAAQWLFTTDIRDGATFRLKGRRMIETEHCPTVGTEGDLILFDPMSYKGIIKSTGVRSAVSMHLRFDYGETAYRWTYRMDAQPLWDAPYTPTKGNTRSPIITLSSSRT